MKLKPRHIFAALLLVGEAPILAPLIAGWLISAAICAVALGVEHARLAVRARATALRRRSHRDMWSRPARTGRPASG